MDEEETFRLLLMENPGQGMIATHAQMKEFHPNISVAKVATLWKKYRGMDHRSLPTHDIETGKRL